MPDRRPNLILIISDDMGYSDLPRFGDSDIPTPALDRLAEQGTLFRQAYVTAPICSPSRMALITGQYHQRFGHYDIYPEGSGHERFEPFCKQATLAEALKPAGYVCGAVGKWHMGCILSPSGSEPWERGFDEFVGIPKGMSDYRPGAQLFRDKEPFEAPEYLTDYWGREACDFIDRHSGEPFFLHLAFNAVHAPLQAVGKDLEAVGEFPSPDRKTYAAMLRGMDRNIGRVLEKLDALGLTDNTIIAFVNDNGGGGNHTPEHTRNTGRNAPLRGFKFDVYEGGIRVPMLLSGPCVPSGLACEHMVSSMDLFPTMLAAAGVEPPAGQVCDGVDLLPCLQDPPSASPHEALFWKNRTWAGPTYQQRPLFGCYNSAVRRGNWKLVRTFHLEAQEKPDEQFLYNQPWQLFDLSADIGEQHDLAAEHPQIVSKLEQEYEDWLSQMHPALFV